MMWLDLFCQLLIQALALILAIVVAAVVLIILWKLWLAFTDWCWARDQAKAAKRRAGWL